MSLGTKNRLKQIADECKAHLRENHGGGDSLVEEFIAEIEGSGSGADPTAWGRFTDLKRSRSEMLSRLDAAYEKWLNPDA
jgi:hypothetical protein